MTTSQLAHGICHRMVLAKRSELGHYVLVANATFCVILPSTLPLPRMA